MGVQRGIKVSKRFVVKDVKGACIGKNTRQHEEVFMDLSYREAWTGQQSTGEMQEAYTHQEGKVVQDAENLVRKI